MHIYLLFNHAYFLKDTYIYIHVDIVVLQCEFENPKVHTRMAFYCHTYKFSEEFLHVLRLWQLFQTVAGIKICNCLW